MKRKYLTPILLANRFSMDVVCASVFGNSEEFDIDKWLVLEEST